MDTIENEACHHSNKYRPKKQGQSLTNQKADNCRMGLGDKNAAIRFSPHTLLTKPRTNELDLSDSNRCHMDGRPQ